MSEEHTSMDRIWDILHRDPPICECGRGLTFLGLINHCDCGLDYSSTGDLLSDCATDKARNQQDADGERVKALVQTVYQEAV